MTQLMPETYDVKGATAAANHLLKILIIEDESPICQVYSAALCLANPSYEIYLAYNGEEGIEIARRDRPDLVILDLLLPGMSGMEVIEELRAEGLLLGVPLIIASGLGEEANHIAAKIGANAFLEKPFPINNLVNAVQHVVATPPATRSTNA